MRHSYHNNNKKTIPMKPTLTLLATLTFTVAGRAQPVLTFATNAPVAGTQYTINYGPYAPPGSAGADQTWDLSTLSSDSTDALELVAPSSTPNGALFPNATVAEVSSPVTTYYQATTDGIHFAGSDDGTSLIVNAPVGKYLAFPCSMGTSWSSPHGATFSYEENDVFRTGTVSGEADGYGTLIMPWGTVPNVLRVHLVNILQDSMSLFTMDYTYDSYIYYAVGQSYPIAELVNATIDFGGGAQTVQFSRWTGEMSTGTSATSNARNELRIYPNPASDMVNITLPGAIGTDPSVTITDAAGRNIRQERLGMMYGSIAPLDVRGLVPGIYQLAVTDGRGHRSATRLSVR